MTVRKIIGLLQESMPLEGVEVVELDERTTDPLQAVTGQLQDGKVSPVMVLGLEKALSSSEPFHPLLHLLNLQRPEWRKRIPRAVVLWIPEYVLSLMGMEAPDFLDWRSDTFFFPTEEPMLDFLTAEVWLGGVDGHIPAGPRRARIEELRSRLRDGSASSDTTMLAARSAWLTELGHHLRVFGESDEAEEAYQQSLAIEQKLQRPASLATAYNNLGGLASMRGRQEIATEMFEKSIAAAASVGYLKGLGHAYTNLASVFLVQKEFLKAEELLQKALELEEELTSRERAASYSSLADLRLAQHEIEEAEKLVKKALRLSRESGDKMQQASNHRQLAQIRQKRGDYKAAARHAKNALKIDTELSNKYGLAVDLALVGLAQLHLDEVDRARRNFRRALDIYQDLGDEKMVSLLRSGIALHKSVPQ